MYQLMFWKTALFSAATRKRLKRKANTEKALINSSETDVIVSQQVDGA